MNFIYYDLGFLVIFTIFIVLFLSSRRKNLKREGLLFLYKTSWGIKLINYVGEKYKRTLQFLSYISIGLGYCLMAGMIYFIYSIVKIYVFRPDIVTAIKIPPIMPLIPYLPQMFKLDFLPPFYFSYWIIIIAVIAITHEFFHGIFARHHDVGIKATGFGFLGPFLAAFVELDEKRMEKKKKFSQLSILSAGTFANVLTAIFFLIVLAVFFQLSFTAQGVVFDSYPYSIVGVSNISSVNGVLISNPSYESVLNSMNDVGLNEIKTNDRDFVSTKEFLEKQDKGEFLILYDDAPAIREQLVGAIIKINGIDVKSKEVLTNELLKYSVGDEIKITTVNNNENLDYEIVLEEHPEHEGVAWLGIGFSERSSSGIAGKVYSVLSSFKKEHVYYAPNYSYGVVFFIYDLLWWLILISFSVALVNMLPLGIFDGGRVFYLTALAVVKDKKKAKNIFKGMTWFLLLIFLILMGFWLFSFF